MTARSGGDETLLGAVAAWTKVSANAIVAAPRIAIRT